MRVAVGALLLGVALLVQVGFAQPPRAKPTSPPRDKEIKTQSSPATIAGKDLDYWIKQLAAEDASRRTTAIFNIMQFGDDAYRAVPALIGRLNDGDVSPRARALLALRTIGVEKTQVKSIVTAVANRIKPNFEYQAVVRYEAVVTLRRYINEASPAIPALIVGTMDKSSWEIRHLCVGMLWRVAVECKLGADPDVVKALLTSVRNEKSFQVKLEALQGLAVLGRPNDSALLNYVVNELNLYARATGRNRSLALWAYAALVAMQDGSAAESNLNTISKFLKNEDLELRIQAAQALGGLGKKAKNKLPLLLALLTDKEPLMVQAGCNALASMGDNSDRVVDGLVSVLDHKNPATAAAAVAALVSLRVGTAAITTRLDKMLEKKDLDIRLRVMIQQGLAELKKPPKK